MSDNTFNVDMDGERHVITVAVDPETKRVAIRVDGRIAARPMAPEELEREVPVGNLKYVVRRLDNDAFDLDLAPVAEPEQFEQFPQEGDPGMPVQPQHPPQKEKSGGGGLKWLMVIAVIAAGFFLSRTLMRRFEYRVAWMPYSAPDGSFKANYSGLPNEDTKTGNYDGETWNVKSVSSKFKNHSYLVEYVDHDGVVTAAGAPTLIQDYFGRWAKQMNASVLSQETASVGGNPALKFVIKIPASADGAGGETVAPGVVAFRSKRVFFVSAAAPEGDQSLPDLGAFVSSFELPPPPAARLKL
jgi:hypothetical protein